MAHVSFILNEQTQTWESPKRVWIQLSTLPQEIEREEMPHIHTNGKTEVIALWGEDNGTRNPWGLLPKEMQNDASLTMDPNFWTKFFEERLTERRKEIEDSIAKHKQEITRMEELLTLYPVPIA